MADAKFRDYKRLVRGFNQFTQMVRCDCINGYGIARKVTAGKTLDQLAITVFVNKKLSLRRLPLSNRIPKTLRIPSQRAHDGVLEFVTDVQEARFSSLEYIARERPAPSGISIGHFDITAGTLGGLVRDKETGNVVILSNNHVLANSNAASLGDPILQPGPADGGTDPADRIATLTRFVEILFDGSENRVDCAIATPVEPNSVIWNTKDVGPQTPLEARVLTEDDLGDFVHKTGRTTEHTQGFVQALFATVTVKYDLFQKATFVDQIIVSQSPAEEAFSNGGDSGSLVYDSQNRCVGLLFAGSEGSAESPATTIVNPINFVLQQLNIEFLQAGDHPSTAAARAKAAKKARRR
ncbi:MAG: serine protease [Acidobacteriota bacterium]